MRREGTFWLVKGSCEQTAESASCTFGDSSDFFVKILRMTLKRVSANTVLIPENDTKKGKCKHSVKFHDDPKKSVGFG